MMDTEPEGGAFSTANEFDGVSEQISMQVPDRRPVPENSQI